MLDGIASIENATLALKRCLGPVDQSEIMDVVAIAASFIPNTSCDFHDSGISMASSRYAALGRESRS